MKQKMNPFVIDNRPEYLFKAIVVGGAGVGKTSYIRRYVHDVFSHNYKATVGVDFHLKVIERPHETVRVQAWDTAGEERAGNMLTVYCRGACGAIIMYDLSRPDTLAKAQKWCWVIQGKLPAGIPIVIIGNKCDLVKGGKDKNNAEDKKNSKDKIPFEISEDMVREWDFLGAFEVSSKERINVNRPMEVLVDAMVERARGGPPKDEAATRDGGVVRVGKEQNERSSCCYSLWLRQCA